jgi:serine O-acetyltransferase
MPLLELLAEDFTTHDRRWTSPGFWAVAAHRLEHHADTIPPGWARRVLCVPPRALSVAVDWMWGIQIPRDLVLGRRVRLWRSGGMVLKARRIGDDVQIRHDTTLGPLRANDPLPDSLPVIEDRVDIGSGVAILGGVVVGHDAVIGHNSVVLGNVPAGSRMVGVPARAERS